jgi:dihydrolipoamide dehydrogenase
MAKKEYDLVVVGSGPGGYVAAIRGSQLGMKTAIVEKENLGGVCLNWGCIPSKALLKNAEIVNLINHDAKTMGLNFDNFSADYQKAFKRSRGAATKNSKGVEFLMKKNKIDVVKGFGKFKSNSEIVILDEDGKDIDAIKVKNSIIATGGRARPIPGIEMDGKYIMDYRDAIMLEELPKSIVIIGAGAIGIEFAYTMNAYGTDVTIVEMLPSILPTMDKEVADVVAKAYKKNKVKMMTETAVKDIKKADGGVIVTVENDGNKEELKADAALVAIGFMPNTENIGLEDVGVETDKGWIKFDKKTFQTTAENIYAIGDVTGEPLLAHAASAEAHECVEQLGGEKVYGYDPANVPGAIYCQPQVASVGMTEEQAVEAGYDIKIGRFPFSANGKARAIGHPEGLVKLIFDKKYGEMLGAHIAGHDATEMISELVVARNLEVTPLELYKTIHPHPTLSEAVMEAAADADGHAVHI